MRLCRLKEMAALLSVRSFFVEHSTEVIKLITQNSSIDPAQLAASGRSEYHPLDINDKARNRRIEIILEPNLKELYKIIK